MNIFATMPTAAEWVAANPPREGLIYGENRPQQLLDMLGIAQELGVEVRFPSHHTSKSVTLPVACYRLAPGVLAYVRDNFHDVNIAVVSDHPISIALGSLYHETTSAYLDEQQAKAEAYIPGKYDFSTHAWYEEWSGGTVLEEDDRLFIAQTTYLEGIKIDGIGYKSPYRPDALRWAVACSSLWTGDFGPRHLCAVAVLQAIKAAAQ